MIQSELEVDTVLLFDVGSFGVGPAVAVDFSVLEFVEVVINDHISESMVEIRRLEPNTTRSSWSWIEFRLLFLSSYIGSSVSILIGIDGVAKNRSGTPCHV